MSPLILVGILGCIAALFATWTRNSQRADVEQASQAFSEHAPSEGLYAGLARVAEPAMRTKAVAELAASPSTRQVKELVVASGMYGGHIEVFLAYQIAAVIVGCALEAVALFGDMSGMARIALGLVGVGVAAWPYNQVSQQAKKVAAEADLQLPEFVEILQVALASSMSIQPALGFALSQFPEGPVSRQVRWLLDTLEAGAMSEVEAYAEAGQRIGSPEAAAFFSVLGQAAVSGARVSESLDRQAATLRVKSHQARRARMKRIPVTLVVAFTVHFLPLLFVITMLPLVSGFGEL